MSFEDALNQFNNLTTAIDRAINNYHQQAAFAVGNSSHGLLSLFRHRRAKFFRQMFLWKFFQLDEHPQITAIQLMIETWNERKQVIEDSPDADNIKSERLNHLRLAAIQQLRYFLATEQKKPADNHSFVRYLIEQLSIQNIGDECCWRQYDAKHGDVVTQVPDFCNVMYIDSVNADLNVWVNQLSDPPSFTATLYTEGDRIVDYDDMYGRSCAPIYIYRLNLAALLATNAVTVKLRCVDRAKFQISIEPSEGNQPLNTILGAHLVRHGENPVPLPTMPTLPQPVVANDMQVAPG